MHANTLEYNGFKITATFIGFGKRDEGKDSGFKGDYYILYPNYRVTISKDGAETSFDYGTSPYDLKEKVKYRGKKLNAFLYINKRYPNIVYKEIVVNGTRRRTSHSGQNSHYTLDDFQYPKTLSEEELKFMFLSFLDGMRFVFHYSINEWIEEMSGESCSYQRMKELESYYHESSQNIINFRMCEDDVLELIENLAEEGIE